ncbi:hypothetical protein [Porcipelethomonas sp.]|uniref:hypothetical protein n=1 Tax=Porcipelethomonas sp. TaxID=2981675 RepID=UPI003EF85ED5
MIEDDTIKLLRECDAGIKMGISSVDDSLKYVQSSELKKFLEKCRNDHDEIQKELEKLLNDYHDDGKEPPVMAKGMSWIKTNFKLAVNESDQAVAEFITDGCNMGIKSLSHYLNQYKAADEKSKDIARKLINIEERMEADIRKYL